MPLSVNELTDHLNKTASGFSCPVCHDSDWYVIVENGFIQETTVLDQGHSSGIEADLAELITEYGGELPEGSNPIRQSPSLLNKVIAIRCNKCGWLGIFDKEFIEEKVHGKNR